MPSRLHGDFPPAAPAANPCSASRFAIDKLPTTHLFLLGAPTCDRILHYCLKLPADRGLSFVICTGKATVYLCDPSAVDQHLDLLGLRTSTGFILQRRFRDGERQVGCDRQKLIWRSLLTASQENGLVCFFQEDRPDPRRSLLSKRKTDHPFGIFQPRSTSSQKLSLGRSRPLPRLNTEN